MIKILFAGDLIPKGMNYEFSSDLIESIADSDLSLVNLEAPITDSKLAISKTGNNFKVDPKEAYSVIGKLPFNIFCLANNHILDFGPEGLYDTVKVLSSLNRMFLGAGENINQAYNILEFSFEGVNIGFLNVAENEFSIATQTNPGAAGFDLVRILEIVAAFKKSYDHLFLLYHGGIEYYQYPSPKLRRLFRFLIDSGFSGIIAHHSHVFACYEYYKKKPIFYGIGNFYSPTNYYLGSKYYESALVSFIIDSTRISAKISPIVHDLAAEQVKLKKSNDSKAFINEVEIRNKVLASDDLFLQKWEAYLSDQRIYYSHTIDCFGNKLIKKLRKIGFWPMADYSSKRAINLLNILRCEAHNEVLIDIITKANSMK